MTKTTLSTIAAAWLLFSPPLNAGDTPQSDLELGEKIYLEGMLPTGKTITGKVKGDIELSGKQVICGTCHRRSGMGSSEGDQVIPAIAGHMIFNPLRLPTATDPLAPLQRPAYTVETLKRAIVSGIDANGRPLDPLMPRYNLSNADLDRLIGYLNTLTTEPSPGVDDKQIHFATIVAGAVSDQQRKALIDVMQTYVTQKNAETRHETFRAENAPWHKKWLFGPYRKWVMHVWELKGPAETWKAQLAAHYREHPVFAVLSGIGAGSWQPVHDFCQANMLPCLFPTTDLPVIDEQDFYPIYLSKGMTLEGELVDWHLQQKQAPAGVPVQVYVQDDLKAKTAAQAFQHSRQDAPVTTRLWDRQTTRPSGEFWRGLLQESGGAPLVLWMNDDQLTNLWPVLQQSEQKPRIYLSATLFGTDPGNIPAPLLDEVFVMLPRELPNRTARLLLRSTGWLRVKGVYDPNEQEIQGNAYLALKVAGDALIHIRGYFFRDYFIERIEHTVDSAPYTSVYPRLSLAPGQRFAAKGGYVAQFAPVGRASLAAVSDWLIPQ